MGKYFWCFMLIGTLKIQIFLQYWHVMMADNSTRSTIFIYFQYLHILHQYSDLGDLNGPDSNVCFNKCYTKFRTSAKTVLFILDHILNSYQLQRHTNTSNKYIHHELLFINPFLKQRYVLFRVLAFSFVLMFTTSEYELFWRLKMSMSLQLDFDSCLSFLIHSMFGKFNQNFTDILYIASRTVL